MERKMILGIVTASLLLLAITLLFPGSRKDELASDLPWKIEPTTEGSIRVFGLTLGKSSIIDTELKVRDEAEVTLFVGQQDGKEHYVVEAYFDPVNLSGLRAIMIVVLDLPQTTLAAMFQRGLRIAKLGSGSHKVTLASEDLKIVRQAPINSITYIPKANLTEEVILRHFGTPELRIRETGNQSEHFLYPQLGLDIALNEDSREVFQYMLPSRFDEVLIPLREKGQQVTR
jgi:hypothetical protein